MAKRNKKLRRPRLFYGRNQLPTWSLDIFLKVAADRGYATKRTICYQLSRAMDVTPESVEHMIRTGKFRWEHILFLGDFFQMTPREFCDVFLHGYFQETSSGHFRAKFEHAMMLLDRKTNVQTRKEVFGEYKDYSELEETIIW